MADRYEVVDQRQTTDLVGGTRFEEVMEVSFRVRSTGTEGRIRVPLRLYTADYVAEQINEFVDRLEGVSQL